MSKDRFAQYAPLTAAIHRGAFESGIDTLAEPTNRRDQLLQSFPVGGAVYTAMRVGHNIGVWLTNEVDDVLSSDRRYYRVYNLPKPKNTMKSTLIAWGKDTLYFGLQTLVTVAVTPFATLDLAINAAAKHLQTSKTDEV